MRIKFAPFIPRDVFHNVKAVSMSYKPTCSMSTPNQPTIPHIRRAHPSATVILSNQMFCMWSDTVRSAKWIQ